MLLPLWLLPTATYTVPSAGDVGERIEGGVREKRWEGRSNVMREDGELRDEREREERGGDRRGRDSGNGLPFFFGVLVINALGGKREAVDQMGGRLIRFRRARTVGLESMGLFGAWERERERGVWRHWRRRKRWATRLHWIPYLVFVMLIAVSYRLALPLGWNALATKSRGRHRLLSLFQS